jgi:hypothetical protein
MARFSIFDIQTIGPEVLIPNSLTMRYETRHGEKEYEAECFWHAITKMWPYDFDRNLNSLPASFNFVPEDIRNCDQIRVYIWGGALFAVVKMN